MLHDSRQTAWSRGQYCSLDFKVVVEKLTKGTVISYRRDLKTQFTSVTSNIVKDVIRLLMVTIKNFTIKCGLMACGLSLFSVLEYSWRVGCIHLSVRNL